MFTHWQIYEPNHNAQVLLHLSNEICWLGVGSFGNDKRGIRGLHWVVKRSLSMFSQVDRRPADCQITSLLGGGTSRLLIPPFTRDVPPSH